jgi:copper chaperone NosL
MTDSATAAERPHAAERSRPRLLDSPIGALPRALLVAAALCLVPAYVSPLWTLTMFAPQYPDGLRLYIYSHELNGGNGGQDVHEINVLNHYIGMRDLQQSDFTEFQWMPFVLGALGLLFLRAAVHGQLAQLLDVLVMSLYFSLFSLWSFGYKLYRYGHDLSATAAVHVAPFMPPLFGHKRLANFDVYSYPALGSYALGAAMAVLAAAFFLAWRHARARAAEA